MPDDPLIRASRRFRIAIKAADTVEALRLLRTWLDHPRESSAVRQAAVDMAHEFAIAVGECPAGAAPARDDAGGLFALGQALLRSGLPGVAATVLLSAHRLDPQDREIGLSAASALLSAGDPVRAREVVVRTRLDKTGEIVAAYLAAFAALGTADLNAARDALAAASPPTNTAERRLIDRIEDMSVRADLLNRAHRLGPTDLRGWHFVLTAGLLLNRSPHGVHMNGRYGYLTDTVASCGLAIDGLRTVLDRLRVAVPAVIAAADTDSRILAEAVARQLSVPVIVRWDERPEEAGLVVVYRLAGQPADFVRHLRQHRFDQVLWVHSANWTQEEPVAGDVTSYLAESSRPVWRTGAERGRVDVDDWVNRIVEIGPIERSASDRGDLRGLLDIITTADAVDGVRAAATRRDGERLRQWAVSPVPSLRL